MGCRPGHTDRHLPAVKQYSVFDYGGMVLTMLLFAMPSFWLAILCQILFCLVLHWLPATGVGSLRHFILPRLLGRTPASMIRMSRTSMLDVLRQGLHQDGKGKRRLQALSHHCTTPSAIVWSLSSRRWASALPAAWAAP